jgi:hypothetical protein
MLRNTLDTDSLKMVVADILRQCHERNLEQNFEGPLLAMAVDCDGSVLLVRESSHSAKSEPTVLAEHCADDTFMLPINVIITDRNGTAGRVPVIQDGSHYATTRHQS